MATATIVKSNNGSAKKITTVNHPITKVYGSTPTVKINYTMPFRIKITNITVPGYGYPNNVPPIGIQVIGFSNWIL